MTRMRSVVLGLLAGVSVLIGAAGTAVAASPTPGWECVPTTAGANVVSGGTGAAPSCAGATTPVLAPTFVSAGVAGKPTVEFSAVNLQIVDGAGVTTAVNGTGNLVIGYAENTKNRPRTGSHDLIVGSGSGWTGYGDLVVGRNNFAGGDYAVALGVKNTVTGTGASILGGESNSAGDTLSTIAGGCGNLTGPGAAMNPTCATSGDESILGGVSNRADGDGNSVAGGDFNTADGTETAIAGGENNTTSSFFSSVAGGQSNNAAGQGVAIAGGLSEFDSRAQDTRVGASTFTP